MKGNDAALMLLSHLLRDFVLFVDRMMCLFWSTRTITMTLTIVGFLLKKSCQFHSILPCRQIE